MTAEMAIVLLACMGTTGLMGLVALKGLSVIAELMVLLKSENLSQAAEYEYVKDLPLPEPTPLPQEYYEAPNAPRMVKDLDGNEYPEDELLSMS
jgi:hypothetical protein